jgi:hypothetical protein
VGAWIFFSHSARFDGAAIHLGGPSCRVLKTARLFVYNFLVLLEANRSLAFRKVDHTPM